MNDPKPIPPPTAQVTAPTARTAQVPPNGAETPEVLLLAKIRGFLIGHLDRPLLKRFRELTGHPLHVFWHEPHDFHDPARLPVLCPAARVLFLTSGTLPTGCARCQRDRWRPLDAASDHGRPVNGACGAAGFRAGVRAGPVRLVTLVLRAATPSPCFGHAVTLLQQVLHEAQAALTAALAHRELQQALRPHPLPSAAPQPLPTVPPHSAAEPGQGAVRTMLEQVHAHYQHPLRLADLATVLNMNASYLSSLFSSTMGVSFHRYLADLRLAKAKELLRDPARHICEIAAATGHSSPSHFDNAFKASVGCSPSAWRAGASEK